MKIIKQEKEKFKPWWVGRKIACKICERVVELEHGDDKLQNVYLGYHKNKVILFIMTCEICNNTTVIDSEEVT